MSQREYAEDTLWWSIKGATEYAPHRRTVLLFHRNASTPALPANPLRWVDNTGAVWPELRAALVALRPARIAFNTDRDVGAAGGLHVGEHAALATLATGALSSGVPDAGAEVGAEVAGDPPAAVG